MVEIIDNECGIIALPEEELSHWAITNTLSHKLIFFYSPKTDVVVMNMGHANFDVYSKFIQMYLSNDEDVHNEAKKLSSQDSLKDILEKPALILDSIIEERRKLYGRH